MPKQKWYSPQLAREVVSQLYYQAKAERIPMTKLANKIIEQALGNKKRTNTRTAAKNHHVTEPN